MTTTTPIIRFTVEMTDRQASWQFAQFLKRSGFSDYRAKATNDLEAYAIQGLHHGKPHRPGVLVALHAFQRGAGRND
jgi:hypothetical protein